MDTATPPPATAPAGWYPDPGGRGQRYWDGAQWTEHIAPLPAPSDQGPTASAGDWIGGVLLPFIMPLVGLIAGIVYVARGGPRSQVGWTCIALSIIAAVVWAAIINGAAQLPPR